jgi:Tfp pilus tip-associated adhesin PilY1
VNFTKRILLTGAMAAGLTAAVNADDRDLLYKQTTSPPNILIVVANSESMATCVPGATGLLNGLTCPSSGYTYGAPMSPFGMGDGAESKMGIVKGAIAQIIKQYPTQFNWGLTTFSVSRQNLATTASQVKRYTFVSTDGNQGGATSSDSSNWSYRAAGTYLNFGQAIGTPVTAVKVGSGKSAFFAYQVVPIGGVATGYSSSTMKGAESWSPTSGGDTLHQPYLLGVKDTSTRTVITHGADKVSSNWEEVVVTYNTTTPSSKLPFQVSKCSSNCSLSSSNDGQYFTVTFERFRCDPSKSCGTGSNKPTSSNNYFFDPTLTGSGGVDSRETATVNYRVPGEYCAETTDGSCAYPQIFANFNSNPQAGEEIGWTDYAESNQSETQAGWITQSNSLPVPIVMIDHPYSPFHFADLTGTLMNYTQNGNPCILRTLRPAASALIADSTGALAEKDYFPLIDGSTDSNASTDALTNCDTRLDGLSSTTQGNSGAWTVQSGFTIKEGQSQQIMPMVMPRTPSNTDGGNTLPLNGMLTNLWQYYAGTNSGSKAPTLIQCGGAFDKTKEIDGFNNARRPDDPFCACRPSYAILITDSFKNSSPEFSFSKGAWPPTSNDPTEQLSALGVPVFVIGFAMPTGVDAGLGAACSGNPVDPNFNLGECIAYATGATVYPPGVERNGYYDASDATTLASALAGILKSLDPRTRDFATATIPSVSQTSEGVAYLSEFNPRNNRSIYAGHLRAFFLDPTTGLLQTQGTTPDPTKFVFATGNTAASGSLIWDAGTTGTDTVNKGTYGNLSAPCPAANCTADVAGLVNPFSVLSASSPTWSDITHDQATGTVGRSVFFGLSPGVGGCSSSAVVECMVQMPIGSGGQMTAEPFTVGSAPSSGSLPNWWATVRDGATFSNIPATVNDPAASGIAARDQALQNSFSFLRGARDPVIESLGTVAAAGVPNIDATHKTCTDLLDTVDSPCYYGDVLGDIFHSNPSIESFPNNIRYFFAQDAGQANPGLYADRSASYQTFFTNYEHRRKILYAGANDGLLHAFDVGIYNGDLSSYTASTGGGGTQTVQPFKAKYDLGSGREIFAFAPAAGLRKAYRMAHTYSQDWTIDGPPSIDDVYIDISRIGASSTVQGVAAAGAGSNSDLSGASPPSSGYAWHSVLIGSEREGGIDSAGQLNATSGAGGSIFALDITEPDLPDSMSGQIDGTTGDFVSNVNCVDSTPKNNCIGVPRCLAVDAYPNAPSKPNNSCRSAYPLVLWEITDDQVPSSITGSPTETTSTGESTTQDLGMTWSQPVIGRIKVSVSSKSRDFFVAIFGGGYSHSGTKISDTNTGGDTGNFLYMADIETGKIIYKRNIGLSSTVLTAGSSSGSLAAGVPGSPGVVDFNNDGYLDFIYIGDTQGRLWKVNISPATDGTPSGSVDSATQRIATTDWNPTLFFDEYAAAVPAVGLAPTNGVRQPIFTRPTVFVAHTNTSGNPTLGIAFGTGDRDNMPIQLDINPNVFVVLTDPPVKTTSPVTLADMTAASATSNLCTDASSCLNGNGFYLVLPTASYGTDANGNPVGAAHIVNTDALAFNQAIFFNTFLHTETAGTCNQSGQAYFYNINYATGVSNYTDPDTGAVVANQSAGEGVEVASTPIVYSDVNTYVVSATDNTSVQKVGGGKGPTAKIKSWKEE